MSIEITLTITKTIVDDEYRVHVVAHTTNINQHVFILDYPRLEFQCVADLASFNEYPIYESGSPPQNKPRYVRVNKADLVFSSPDEATSGIAYLKKSVDALCVDYNTYSDTLIGEETYTVTSNE